MADALVENCPEVLLHCEAEADVEPLEENELVIEGDPDTDTRKDDEEEGELVNKGEEEGHGVAEGEDVALSVTEGVPLVHCVVINEADEE